MKTLKLLAFVVLCGLLSCTGGNTAVSNSKSAQPQDTVRQRIVDTISIAMTGDIMTGSKYPRPCLPPNEGKEIFQDCDSIIKGADVACGNLEGVLADSGRLRKSLHSKLAFSFMMPTAHVQLLVDAGFDFMGIANNHIFDFWDEGIESTIKTLKGAGIGVAGTKACETSIKDINGVKYGFCAFGHEDYSLKTWDTIDVKRIVKQLRKESDIVIVCFHGGAEGVVHSHVPYGVEYFHSWNRGDVREFAHLAIDCGADIVYGHGPHVPRAMELYKDHLIAYSLGNFATIGMGTAGAVGYAPLLVARIDGDGKFVDGKIHSMIQPGKIGPRTDAQNRAAHTIWNLTQEDIKDNKLNIADDGTITRK